MPGRPILLRNQGGGTNYLQAQAANSVAPISVYAVNYPRYRARENKTMALLSALMLMVATSGLFAASSLTWVDFSSLNDSMHDSTHNSSIQASGWRADSALTWDPARGLKAHAEASSNYCECGGEGWCAVCRGPAAAFEDFN